MTVDEVRAPLLARRIPMDAVDVGRIYVILDWLAERETEVKDEVQAAWDVVLGC